MRLIHRLPFTIFMELAIISVAVAHDAVVGELNPAAKERWGFGFHSLWKGRLYTLVTSVFFVRDRRMFAGMLILIGYSVGVYEWLVGTRRTLLLYWSTNTLGLLLTAWSVVAPLYYAGTPLGRKLALMSDVGPSAGALGVIGGWVDRLPARYQRRLFLTIMLYLTGKLTLSPEPFADSVHLIAFPLGFGLDRWLWLNGKGA